MKSLIEKSQEDCLKHKRGLAGIICCFLLFIVVCFLEVTNMKGAFRASGHPERYRALLPVFFHVAVK